MKLMTRDKDTPVAILMVLVLMFVGLALLPTCSDSDSDKDAGPSDDGSEADSVECRFPPLNLCEPPGSRDICPDNWYCPGCNCTGPQKAAACSLLTQDCRWFCTGCIPDGYVNCSDKKAPPPILGRCGYCFHSDGGVSGEVREDCDRLDAILDAQPPSTKDGG